MLNGMLPDSKLEIISNELANDKLITRALDGTSRTPDEAVAELMPQRGLRRAALTAALYPIQQGSYAYWKALDLQSGIRKPYGLKETSGIENLEGLAKDASLAILAPHLTETDYIFWAYLHYATGLRGHFVAGKNLVVTKDEKEEGKQENLKKQIKAWTSEYIMNGTFDFGKILRINRDGPNEDQLIFAKAYDAIHQAGGNVIVFPGGTRDRANSAHAEGEYFGLPIKTQRRSKHPIYVLPVSITYDHIFRGPQKVHQLVTGYARQDASELGGIAVPMLWDAITQPMYLHVGQLISMSGYSNTKEDKDRLTDEFNKSIVDGVYATPMNIVGLAVKNVWNHEQKYSASTEQLGRDIKKELESRGINPKKAVSQDIQIMGQQVVGGGGIEQTMLVDEMRQILLLARDMGVRMPRILDGKNAWDIYDIAMEKSGAGEFISRPGYSRIMQVIDPLVASYYAGPLERRLGLAADT